MMVVLFLLVAAAGGFDSLQPQSIDHWLQKQSSDQLPQSFDQHPQLDCLASNSGRLTSKQNRFTSNSNHFTSNCYPLTSSYNRSACNTILWPAATVF
jgi:hypothetical protein